MNSRLGRLGMPVMNEYNIIAAFKLFGNSFSHLQTETNNWG
jgi:hypothetical protein